MTPAEAIARLRQKFDGHYYSYADMDEVLPVLLDVAEAANGLARKSEYGGVGAINSEAAWKPLVTALARLADTGKEQA